MPIVKLTQEGDSLTMQVKDCEPVKGNFGEQVKFTATNGDILFLPKDSADRQLERCQLDYATAIGETLTFSRDKNKKPGAAPFWGITVANVRDANPAPSKRIAPPSGAPPQRKALPFDEEVPLPPDPDEPLYREEPKRTPREAREAETGISDRERAYLATWRRVARDLAIVCQNEGIPLDASAVQAATFSVFNSR